MHDLIRHFLNWPINFPKGVYPFPLHMRYNSGGSATKICLLSSSSSLTELNSRKTLRNLIGCFRGWKLPKDKLNLELIYSIIKNTNIFQ